MKEITKYQAEDGAVFNSVTACEEYEVLLNEVQAIMSALESAPDTCDFANGDGYVQQDLQSVSKINSELDTKWAGHPERYPQPVKRARLRMSCIDSQGREWGQPYFTRYPQHAKEYLLNETL